MKIIFRFCLFAVPKIVLYCLKIRKIWQVEAKDIKGYKEFYLISGAGHAESVLTDPKAYLEYVASFLETLGIQEKTNDLK